MKSRSDQETHIQELYYIIFFLNSKRRINWYIYRPRFPQVRIRNYPLFL